MVWIREETVESGRMGISILEERRLECISCCLVLKLVGILHCLKTHEGSSSTSLRVVFVKEKDDANMFAASLIQPLNSCQWFLRRLDIG